jgi:hypothetical protein
VRKAGADYILSERAAAMGTKSISRSSLSIMCAACEGFVMVALAQVLAWIRCAY